MHQTALYDLILVAILLGVLLWLRRKPRFDGFLIMFFGAWYACERILEDFLRQYLSDDTLDDPAATALLAATQRPGGVRQLDFDDLARVPRSVAPAA